jgi:NADH-quinone oxidoreductase subunit G
VLGFIDRGSHTVLTAHPGKRLENNYSLNTVDLCPVGALTSTDFRFKMRVWFLKETKSFCTSCATGCNTLIGTREDIVYRQTPRENDHVNSCWMCDYGRLNFKYLESENRLIEPQISNGKELEPGDWKNVIAQAALQLRQFSGGNIGIIASGRMTNEELWLTRKIADLLDVRYIDIVPRRGEGDDILLSEDRNPNTAGARLILRLDEEPGAKLPALAKAVKSGGIRALLALGENPIDFGISAEELTNMPAFVAMDILSNSGNQQATILLPASGFAEKRGSMINGEGRLQRLNRAVRPPGNARDDWEILRDLLQALGGSNGIYTIEDVFRQMSTEIPEFSGLTLSKIGDLGTHIMKVVESPRPPRDLKEKDIEQAEKRRPVGR